VTLHAIHPEAWRPDCPVCRRLAEIRDHHLRLAADPGIVDEPYARTPAPRDWSRLVAGLAFAGLAAIALLAWLEWGPR
jgi:hypothetical protein